MPRHCGNILLPFMKSMTCACVEGEGQKRDPSIAGPTPRRLRVWGCRPRVRGGAHLVLADELLDPRVDRLGHPHGGRAVHDARARRQLQRCGRLEECREHEEPHR